MNIKELQDRYKIASRSALYSRLKAIEINLDKDSSGSAFATETQVKLLDDLDQHLKSGGNLKNFASTSDVSVLSPSDRQNSTIVSTKKQSDQVVQSSQDTVQSVQYSQLNLFQFQDLMDVGVAIASQLKSPINHWKELIYAADNNLILSTSEIQQLTGVKPFGSEWVRGSFRFVRSGKIGSQSAWKIEKIS
jgi:hypothetical protein